jgi:uncharacterized SAM-binding protein YcdF (DUF218 family)
MTIAYLSQLIKPWLLPPGFCILLGVIGLLSLAFWRKTAIFLLILSVVSLWLFSMPLFAYKLIAVLQNQYPLLQSTKLLNDPASAIVVLGGGDTIDVVYGNKHTVSDTTFHRLRYAAYLYKNTPLSIIVSGGSANGATDTEADLMKNTLKDDFNIDKVIKEDKSNNTAEESKYLMPILQQYHFKHIYLVTNAWHMPRSVYAFSGTDIDVIPAPMGYAKYVPDYHSALTYLPSIDALNTTSIALHEFIGLFWYRLNRTM